jgi:hypothetical protein
VTFPPIITTLPVYHIKNFEEPQNPFGSSEMRGIERIMAAVNQSITDEELSLALAGLGMYKSNKAAPEGGRWILGPGKVVHDDTFERIEGVRSVLPFQEHLKYLHGQMDEVMGISDVAKGGADVSIAESGIALTLRMGPILSTGKRKDRVIREVMDNFLFDLRNWFKAYEAIDMENVRFQSNFGDKMPTDVETEFNRLLQMYSADPPLITAAYFRDACREMGMKIPTDITGAAIAEERAGMAEAMDPYGARVQEEIDGAGGEEDVVDEEPVE